MPKTSVVTVKSVFEIDAQKLKQNGVMCVLFDVEGTITPWRGSSVSEKMKDCIERLGIEKRGIVTNMHRSHADRARDVARQIKADSCQYPADRTYRKPRARMLQQAMDELRVTPQQTVMCGDKLLDVMAAKNAGVQTVFWVNKYGQSDQWFDTYVYRKLEPLLKRIVR